MRRSYYCDDGDNSEETGYDEFKYGYDAYNRQISYYNYEVDYVGDYEDETKATYTYDAIGRRASKKVDGAVTTHRWDGSSIVGDSGTGAATYYRGINIIAQNKNNAVNYYVYDGHGNTVTLTDANGATVSKCDYSAYGNRTSIKSSINTPFKYCGEYQDNESGMVYLRNRYYKINEGRFTQEDPAKDGLNWYAYCGNNPVNFVDPWGLKPGDLYLNDNVINKDYLRTDYTSGTYIAATDIVSGYYGYVEYGDYGDYIFGVGDYVFVLDPNSIGMDELGYATVINKYTWENVGEVRYTKTQDVDNPGCVKMLLQVDDMKGVADMAGISTTYCWEIGPEGGTYEYNNGYIYQTSTYIPVSKIDEVYQIDYGYDIASGISGENLYEILGSIIGSVIADSWRNRILEQQINYSPKYIDVFQHSSYFGESFGGTEASWSSFHICNGTNIGYFYSGIYF